MPDAEQLVGIDQVELLKIAARAHAIGGDWARGELLLRKAIEEGRPGARPRPATRRCSRGSGGAQWRLNRGREGLETSERALAMLRPGEEVAERAAAARRGSRATRVLRGRFRDAVRRGEEALVAAVEAGDRDAEGEVLNTLGMARIALGEVERRDRCTCARAIELARVKVDDLDATRDRVRQPRRPAQPRGPHAEALDDREGGASGDAARLMGRRDWMELTVVGDGVRGRRLGAGARHARRTRPATSSA